MTTRKNNTIIKVDSFWENIFHPKDDDLIRVKSHLLAGQYLKQIEQVLDSKEITQKDLAGNIKISPSYLSQLFSGNKLPSWKTLAKIELALNIKFELMPSIKNNKYAFPFRSTDSFLKKESLIGVSMNDDCTLKIA